MVAACVVLGSSKALELKAEATQPAFFKNCHFPDFNSIMVSILFGVDDEKNIFKEPAYLA